MLSDVALPTLLGLAVTFAASILIGLTKRWHGSFSYDSVSGPQKFHTSPTPRIGGLVVYGGYWAATIVAPAPVRGLMITVGASAAAAFLSGAIEDLTKGCSALVRLVAALVSGLMFCLVTGYVVAHVDVFLIDLMLALPWGAVIFTAFVMAGVTHAVNIVDGFHGLATGTAIIMMAAFMVVSLRAGDQDLALFCLITTSVMLGFLLVNFPSGYIFLGDGGAYFLGFVLASTAIMVPARNPDVSPLISLVILAYPVLETGFSVVRKILNGRKPYQPDNAHLHMLVYKDIVKRLPKAVRNERVANPVTGLLMWVGAATGLVAVSIIPHDRDWSLRVLALLLALYALAYWKAAWAGSASSVKSKA